MTSAIIFDLDDTLFDHARAMEQFLRIELGVPAHAVEDLLQVDQRGHAPRGIACSAIGAVVGRSGEEVWCLMQTSLANYVEPLAPDVVEEAVRRFRVAILSNGGTVNQRGKIARLGLDRLVAADRVFVSAELGVEKPDRAAFVAVLKALDVPPERAVHVGDHPVQDVAGARGAGVKSCWVARGRAFPDTPAPDWTIQSIADLPHVWDQFPT